MLRNNELNVTSPSVIACSLPCLADAKTTEQAVFNNKHIATTVKNQSLFSDSRVIFPHEDTIAKALASRKKDYNIGLLYRDEKEKYISNGIKKIKFNHNVSIFKPSKSCVAAIAHYYKKKYDINIYYITENVKNSLYELAQLVTKEKHIGVIAHLTNIGHVTPLILWEIKNTLYIVVFDSVFEKVSIIGEEILEELCLDLTQYNAKNCHILYAGVKRQTDGYSCVNDAVIILKDALREPDLINNLLKNITADIDSTGKSRSQYKTSTAKFPKFLYKTVQNKKLLDELTGTDLQTPLKSSKLATKTLKTHLEKYNRAIVATTNIELYSPETITTYAKNWEVNTYLLTKGYRLLLKAFEVLDDGNGNIDYNKKRRLEEKYVNPSPQILEKHKVDTAKQNNKNCIIL